MSCAGLSRTSIRLHAYFARWMAESFPDHARDGHDGNRKAGLMCGIIAILGKEPVAIGMVEALKRLEYRGYDSAGVATLENGRLTRRRAEGKLKNLEQRLSHEPLVGTIGIGHTRWATHGRPNEINAHPHATDTVAVVHNGIIENFRELRESLGKNGSTFSTETDSEVVAHLVTDEMKKGRSPAD